MSQYSEEKLVELRKKFPVKFRDLPFLCPPEDSKPQTLKVYRACKNRADELTKEDFLPSDEEGNLKQEPNKPAHFSVSFFGDKKAIKKIVLKYASQRGKHLVYGTIKSRYGFARQSKNSSHIDLWMYQDAKPWLDFLSET